MSDDDRDEEPEAPVETDTPPGAAIAGTDLVPSYPRTGKRGGAPILGEGLSISSIQSSPAAVHMLVQQGGALRPRSRS
ncbi:MAG: hypothetical protein J0L92_03570 [Deltaproteobacteria bacterium]|nr:hypothetical protein [Deltaproteobacteria bacterium]